MRITTEDGAGTEQVGAELAATLEPGDVVLLSGDLGSGKTTLVRGAARALGVVTAVTSPTFAIGSRYPVPAEAEAEAEADTDSHSGGGSGSAPAPRRPAAVSHLDLYRLGDLGAEDPDLLADYISAETVAFVEWPGAAEAAIAELGRIRFRVTLDHAGEDRRIIEIDAS